jgi:hypothetical protein
MSWPAIGRTRRDLALPGRRGRRGELCRLSRTCAANARPSCRGSRSGRSTRRPEGQRGRSTTGSTRVGSTRISCPAAGGSSARDQLSGAVTLYPAPGPSVPGTGLGGARCFVRRKSLKSAERRRSRPRARLVLPQGLFRGVRCHRRLRGPNARSCGTVVGPQVGGLRSAPGAALAGAFDAPRRVACRALQEIDEMRAGG